MELTSISVTDTLKSVLEASKNYIGQDKREICNHLIEEIDITLKRQDGKKTFFISFGKNTENYHERSKFDKNTSSRFPFFYILQKFNWNYFIVGIIILIGVIIVSMLYVNSKWQLIIFFVFF